MLCALIMAGGKGTRFWPLSTEDNPKQFLKLLGEKTMIQMTVDRLQQDIPLERIFVVTDQKYIHLVEENLPGLPKENIIAEPVGMNTAPCIALSAMLIDKKYPDATLAVLPSDHLIEDEESFRYSLRISDNYLGINSDAIITLGMKVTRPEVGYGYIKYNSKVEFEEDIKIHQVEQFVEKPNKEIAQKYMNEDNYLWNGGMFIWKTTNIISLTEKYLAPTYNVLKDILSSSKEDFNKVLCELYPKVQNISVDYGIMEKANQIYVIPSDFGWDDIGSWLSLERYRESDDFNNITDGQIKLLKSKGNIAVSKTKPMVLCGVKDLILVETEDIILVTKKDEIENINQLRTAL